VRIGIYYRKFLFFTLVLALSFGGWYLVKETRLPSVSASVEDNLNQSFETGYFYLEMDLQKDGSILIDDKKIKEGVQPRSDQDEFRYIILNQPDETYVEAEVVLNLPQKITKLYSEPEIIAVHGARSDGAYLDESGKKVVYRASDISNSATVTIVAQFPEGYLELPAAERLRGTLGKVSGLIWLAGGLVLPPIALIILLYILYKSDFKLFGNLETEGKMEYAPSLISPALVNVLVYGRVGARTLMAMLVDLATRGYIEIFNQGNDFVIYRRSLTQKQLSELKPWEKILIEKIFLPKQSKAGAVDVQARLARHLFSRKIAAVYLALYWEGKDLGYFEDLPAKLHLRYRMLGILIFFLGFFGYGFFALFGPDPKFALFFWLSLIILGVLIVRVSPLITAFTAKGKAARNQWLKFRNYMIEDKEIRGWSELFDQYLPYAFALNCEADWAARFVKTNFVKPDWYDHVKLPGGIEGFVKSFWPVINFISEELNLSSEPMVK